MNRLLGSVLLAALLSGLASPVRAADDKEVQAVLDKAIKAPGPTHHGFSKIPSARRISWRKVGSSAAAKRFLAMLSVDG